MNPFNEMSKIQKNMLKRMGNALGITGDLIHTHQEILSKLDQQEEIDLSEYLDKIEQIMPLFQGGQYALIIEQVISMTQYRDGFLSNFLALLKEVHQEHFNELLIQMISKIPDLNSSLILNIAQLIEDDQLFCILLEGMIGGDLPLFAQITLLNLIDHIYPGRGSFLSGKIDPDIPLELPQEYIIYHQFKKIEASLPQLFLKGDSLPVSMDMIAYILHIFIGDNQPSVGIHKAILKQKLMVDNRGKFAEIAYKECSKRDYFSGALSIAVAFLEPVTLVKKLQHELVKRIKGDQLDVAEILLKAFVSLNTPEGWQVIDDVATLSDQKYMKRVARGMIEDEAVKKQLTPDQFLDSKVSSYGFNSDHQLIFDYGCRTFTATITSKLDFSLIEDATGKQIKSLPKPKGDDDTDLANSARERFHVLKRAFVDQGNYQRGRLERNFGLNRLWPVAIWQSIFIENPLMEQFAIGLIWGIQTGDQLTSFRYLKDGGFCDHDQSNFTFHKEGEISLIYPSELEEPVIQKWRQQLKEDEIIQPFNQLGRICYRASGGDNRLSDFNGETVDGSDLRGCVTQYGWDQGPVTEETDRFFTYEFQINDVAVVLNFSGDAVKPPKRSYQVILYDIVFYRIEDDLKISVIPTNMVSDRLYSEIYLLINNLL